MYILLFGKLLSLFRVVATVLTKKISFPTCLSHIHPASAVMTSTHSFISALRRWPMTKKLRTAHSIASPGPSTSGLRKGRRKQKLPLLIHLSVALLSKIFCGRMTLNVPWSLYARRWAFDKIYYQVLPILLFLRDLSKVTFGTPTNSRWHSVFVSLRPLACWCTTGRVPLWLLTNIWEVFVTDFPLDGSKPWRMSVGSGRVAHSCWRWCCTLCETSLIITGYRRESVLGATLCR